MFDKMDMSFVTISQIVLMKLSSSLKNGDVLSIEAKASDSLTILLNNFIGKFNLFVAYKLIV